MSSRSEVPNDMEKVMALKSKYGFTLLEDACAAMGSTYTLGAAVPRHRSNRDR